MDESERIGEVVEEVGRTRHEWTVIVNGRPKVVHHDELGFEQVVHLAFEHPPTGPNVVITVTYARAAGPRPDGTLTKGQRVKIKDGTVLNVRATDKS
jgi:Multiubiquitin